tara:strand:- start:482 stop:988 length:507 start_codon:yes stop_codon:yes gene_type:complete
MAQALFIRPQDIKRFTAANGNIDDDRFIQYLFIAQEIHIQRFLGSDLTESIEAKINASSLTGNYLTLVQEYVKPALCHWAMVEALPFLAINIGQNGIFRGSSENGTPATKDEVDFLVEKERQTAQYFSNRLIDFLRDNAPEMFPEYYTNTGNRDISPDDEADFVGIVL